jgi:hypothetical protein
MERDKFLQYFTLELPKLIIYLQYIPTKLNDTFGRHVRNRI